MKKTIAKITHKCTYRVVHDTEAKCNPYTVYREWYNNGKHTIKLTAYEDMTSCLYHIAQLYNLHGI